MHLYCEALLSCVVCWPGMNALMDQMVYGGRIIAYQIQWSNGWSNWFVPGMNDLDAKYNAPGYVPTCSVPYPVNGLRRVWSYFYDHTFKIIICKTHNS